MDHNIIIRPYESKDSGQVKEVCLKTGYEQEMPPKRIQEMLLTAFCRYYIEQEPENCFVADDGGRAIGYILCAQDSGVWAEEFPVKYVPDWNENPLKEFYQGIMKAPLKYEEDFPAHLHIDILPGYQHMGIGTRLMDALTGHLKKKGIHGLMLSVSGDNTNGKNFYEKYGFHVLEDAGYEIVMGLQLA